MSGDMRTVSVRQAAAIAGDPYEEIAATKGLADGVEIPELNEDYSAENGLLSCFIGLAPGSPALVTLPVSVTVETDKDWQYYLDCGEFKETDLPCEVKPANYGDKPPLSVLGVSWGASSLNTIPTPTIDGKPVVLYFEIRRTNGSGGIFVVGDFIVTERLQ